MGTCFVLGSVFHIICVCTKFCQLPALQAAQYLQRNQTSKPEATGRLCLPLPQRQLCVTTCASLLYRHSLLHVNYCVCSPGTSWEKACGKHSFMPLKRVWNKAMKTVAFFFSFQHNLLLTWKKLLQKSLHYRKRTKKSEIEMQPKQVHVALPNAVSFFPIPFSFDIAGRLFSWHSWKENRLWTQAGYFWAAMS